MRAKEAVDRLGDLGDTFCESLKSSDFGKGRNPEEGPPPTSARPAMIISWVIGLLASNHALRSRARELGPFLHQAGERVS